jgi:hypothetical protein
MVCVDVLGYLCTTMFHSPLKYAIFCLHRATSNQHQLLQPLAQCLLCPSIFKGTVLSKVQNIFIPLFFIIILYSITPLSSCSVPQIWLGREVFFEEVLQILCMDSERYPIACGAWSHR